MMMKKLEIVLIFVAVIEFVVGSVIVAVLLIR